jgi:FAD/FMN-containing dehydrogenase/Fe-S oxidoreductase
MKSRCCLPTHLPSEESNDTAKEQNRAKERKELLFIFVIKAKKQDTGLMNKHDYREIPYNFTSADDKLIINHLFGPAVWGSLEELRSQRITGRSARLVMRFMGDLFIMRRNPYLYQELIDSPLRRNHFFRTAETDLQIIEKGVKKVGVSEARSSKVLNLVHICRNHLKKFIKDINGAKARRGAIKKHLSRIVDKESIVFDPFTLISHATDATDWRLYLPVAVVYPAKESEVAPLLQAITELKLHAIPRGGGTGLTGGSVPVRDNCIVINTSKLNRIGAIRQVHHLQNDMSRTVPVLPVEAGVITQDAMAAAEKEGLVFATDPTSAWASTIGGNISENAGGKTAVLWGTAIDNILSYSIAMPVAGLCTITRVDHPLRKILPDDTVTFTVRSEDGRINHTINLSGTDIRKKGLWKDITNKALGGLPGFQKEGTDGIITSAEFILHQAYPKKITFCLEFFGDDMDEASRVIVEISEEFANGGAEALMALEHFDEEYIKAINYKFKAARSERPKAVLLIDMVGHTDAQIERGRKRFEKLLDRYGNTELFVAKDADEASRFWRDRKRLGAIAARTNAFKLNEDIVLPLPALAEFARFVDTYNIDEDIHNKEVFIQQTMEYLKTAVPIEDPDWLEAKLPKANELCLNTIDKLQLRTKESIRHEVYIKKLMDDLLELFRGYSRVSQRIKEIFAGVREKRIIIATHMHAGDGNVHVNIPVFSNDREMMRRAEKTAEDIMAKAVELDGVVSGEHGIGITKMKFLDKQRRKELHDYRKEVDPHGIMNPGMLEDPNIINKVFTPSFNLLELEARILQHGSLEALSSKISRCVRCGKCKPDCCVFIPEANVFFHPRNKNLAIGSLIEALLYDMQRSHFPRFNQLKNLDEIADHCTMCGKCLAPCPVDIDTAEVSILEREILADIGYKKSPVATGLSLLYLKSRNRLFNQVFRRTVLDWGGRVQRLAVKALQKAPEALQQSTSKAVHMLKSPMVPPSSHSLRDLLPKCANSEALLFSPAKVPDKTIFYFPGCGSERLYANISKAALYILLKSNIQVVLPPPYLCCGFPSRVNAKKKMHSQITLRDTILFSQIRDMLGHIRFDAVLISCGTCRESLAKMGCEDIFSCKIEDISAYVLHSSKAELFTNTQGAFLYHAPCHDSLNGDGGDILRQLNLDITTTPNCCSEAGTMAISRPDISSAMRSKKRHSIKNSSVDDATKTILTNCPSCISGLGRNSDMGIIPLHVAEMLAIAAGGQQWTAELEALLQKYERITF